MRFGLKDQAISDIKSVFSSYLQIEAVILYGSRAMGTYRHSSDINLTVVGGAVTYSLHQKIKLFHSISAASRVAHVVQPPARLSSSPPTVLLYWMPVVCAQLK